MYFVGAGIVLMIMKYLAYGPVTNWPWPLVLSPFGMAMIWWWIADKSGMTARKTMDREQQRKLDRIERNRANMGLPGKPKQK